jgi:serine/threonine protein kinase/tetratricopeptide (TPR) repeat protein
MSDTEFHIRASELFLRLRALPAHQRGVALDALANGDEALRSEVLELLAHDVDGSSASPIDASTPARGDNSFAGSPLLPHVGMIGPYRVVSRIGRGSSGHVFLAEQEKPIQRRVAIKVVPQAAINEELAARFEVERRALECTEHPNIARVLDAGRTPDGLPYLVMDYVEGEPITAYCQRRTLRLSNRIRLMLDVADALQHVHQRGVIHRDIKPANILVTEAGGKAVPHVLDFGIAKPIAGTPGVMSAESPPTSGLPLGTPSYMAPEQTGLQTVDTRADVYALGAVLYELVAGEPPIDAAGDPVEVLQRIRNQVPPSASRVRAQQAAAHRFEHVPASLLADLDCILACALEKSPERRYATVGAFADDLTRMLRFEPISARPPTLGYRTARFVQRNRILVGAAALVAITTIAAAVAVTMSLVEANRQRAAAIDQYEAQREINVFLTDDLLAAASPDELGKDVTALELLQRASKRVDDRFPNRPLVAASIHHTLGDAYAVLGAFDEADRHLSKALELRRTSGGADAQHTVHSEIAYASLLARQEKLAEAEPALRHALARAERILEPDDPAIETACNDLAVVVDALGKHEEAAELLERARTGRIEKLGPNHPKVLMTVGNLALAYSHLGQTERAIELMHEALRIVEAQPEPSTLLILGLNNNIGATYQDLDRNEEAAPYLRKAAELAHEFLGSGHPATLTIQGNLAGLESDLGDPERAAEIYASVIKERTLLFGAAAQDTLTARFGYWSCLWKAKRFDEAAAGFAELLPDSLTTLGEAHWFTAQTRASLARALLDAGNPADALPLAEQAEAQFMQLYGAEHNRTKSTANTLALIRKRLGE